MELEQSAPVEGSTQHFIQSSQTATMCVCVCARALCPTLRSVTPSDRNRVSGHGRREQIKGRCGIEFGAVAEAARPGLD